MMKGHCGCVPLDDTSVCDESAPRGLRRFGVCVGGGGVQMGGGAIVREDGGEGYGER